ncbi:MAG: type I DNA topoisomerase [Rhodothermales bacterium]
MRLLIVESPTKAATLAGTLGAAYRVRATEGHVADLPEDELGIDIEDSFEATWKTAKGKRNVLAALRRDAEGCKQILLATDPDREGEAIARHLADALARTKIPTARVFFRELTPEAVRTAVARPRSLDADLVAAQQARRVVDRLVGYAVSPVLQRSVDSPKPLSAGRVQTAALRLLCERERAVADFQPGERWSVETVFHTAAEVDFPARLHKAYGQVLETDTLDQGAAWQLAEAAKASRYSVRSIRLTTDVHKPPPPFTTAALLQSASDVLGLEPAATMRLAQQLYEGIELEDDVPCGLLTYPRTDGVHMAKPAIAAARNVIARDYGTAYLPSRPNRHTVAGASARNGQEAHEALRPTDFARSPKSVRKYLRPEQYRLYELVYDRAVASQMAPAVLERATADVADSGNQFVFRAEGVRVRTRGFLQFEAAQPEDAPLPPSLEERETVLLRTITHARRATVAPTRYTEAGLVGAMEAEGIGRPSTYAATLGTLRERGYAVRRERHLQPTDLGLRACAFLVHRFPALFDLRFTARMEAGLDAIAAGKTAYRPMMHAFYHGDLLPALRSRDAAPSLPNGPGRTAARRGPATAANGEPECERCGKPMVLRDGPHGAFYGCSGFPACRQTRSFEPPAQTRPCPRCGTGHIVERTTKRGRPFEGCSAYPACDFSRWVGPAVSDSVS